MYTNSHKHTQTDEWMDRWRESHWHLTCSESGTWEVGWPAFPYPWPWTVSSRPVRSTAARQFLLLCRGEKTQTHTHHDWQTVGGGHITNNTSPHACLQSSHTGMEVSVKKKKKNLGFIFIVFISISCDNIVLKILAEFWERGKINKVQ